MHITDIVQNSVRAEARLVRLDIEQGLKWLTLRFKDDGIGMDAETLRKATDPFYTSRNTRKVGLGLPLLKQNAEMAEGTLEIDSVPGEGTELVVRFRLDHIDIPPMGDLPAAIAMLITGNPDTDLVFSYQKEDRQFILDSRQVKDILGEVDIRMPGITRFLKEMISENLNDLDVDL